MDTDTNTLYAMENGEFKNILYGKLILTVDPDEEILLTKSNSTMLNVNKPKTVEEILQRDIKQGNREIEKYQQEILKAQDKKRERLTQLKAVEAEAQKIRLEITEIGDDIFKAQKDLQEVFSLVQKYKGL